MDDDRDHQAQRPLPSSGNIGRALSNGPFVLPSSGPEPSSRDIVAEISPLESAATLNTCETMLYSATRSLKSVTDWSNPDYPGNFVATTSEWNDEAWRWLGRVPRWWYSSCQLGKGG